FGGADKMIRDGLMAIATGFFCFFDNSFKFAPLDIVEKRHDFTCGPVFGTVRIDFFDGFKWEGRHNQFLHKEGLRIETWLKSKEGGWGRESSEWFFRSQIQVEK